MKFDSKPRPIVVCVLLIAYCLLLSCSLPNLEEPDCIQARDVVREFYSLHFANDVPFAEENVDKRKVFLTPRFLENLRDRPREHDPFTATNDLPKAFRVGKCRVIQPQRRVSFNLLLFWKTDVRTEQRAIDVGVENTDGKWLIDSVSETSSP